MTVSKMLTWKGVKIHQEVTGNNVQGGKGIRGAGSENSDKERDDYVRKWEDCARVEE